MKLSPEDTKQLIEEKADDICGKYSIKDKGTVIDILKNTHTSLGFCLSLEEALQYFNFKEAKKLFATDNLLNLWELEQTFRRINSIFTDVYSFYELENNLNSYLNHLETDRKFIIKTGLPRRSFERCRWLDWQLSCSYPTRAPVDDEVAGTDKDGNAIYKYYWEYSKNDGFLSKFGRYEDADFLEGLCLAGIEKELESKREHFVGWKWSTLKDITELMAARLPSGMAGDSIIKNCIDRAKDTLTIQDFDIYRKADACYSHIFKPEGLYTWGGAIQLFFFVSHIAEECEEGLLAEAKSKYIGATADEEVESAYQLLKKLGEEETFTLFGDIASSIEKQQQSRCKKYEQMLHVIGTSLRKGVSVEVPVEEEYANDLEELGYDFIKYHATQVEKTGVFLSHPEYKPEVKSSIAGKLSKLGIDKWEDIFIRYRDEESIHIITEKRPIIASCRDMGMENSKTEKPDEQWYFFMGFFKTEELGFIPSRYLKGKNKNDAANIRKKKSKLSGALQEYFGIDEDPLYNKKTAGGYKLKMNIVEKESEDVLDKAWKQLEEEKTGEEDSAFDD